MSFLNRGVLIIFFFLSFVFTLIFNSFALTTSYLEMTNLYEQTQEAADMAHEITASKKVIDEISKEEKDEDVYLYNREAFKETFSHLMELTQVKVDYVQIDRDKERIKLYYRSGNEATIEITEMNTEDMEISFNYDINVLEDLNYTIDRSFRLNWDVRRKAGEY